MKASLSFQGRLIAGIAGLLLLPLPAGANDDIAAAVVARCFDTVLRFEDGAANEYRFQRAGIEYWESIGGGMFAGFGIGYAEDEARDAGRPFELASGNYGSLGLRFETPLNAYVELRGRAEYLVQRGTRDSETVEFETRGEEVRAEFGPRLRVQRFELATGASWRSLDYRETALTAAGEQVRRADADDEAGAFAVLGWYANTGGRISLRYDDGPERGWTLRFEQSY